MEATTTPQPPAPTPHPRTGLAIACLVLGILAVFSSILVVGAFAGLLAILLGAIHIIKRRGPNGMAWTGIALSVLSIVVSVALGALYATWIQSGWDNVRSFAETETQETSTEFADWVGEPLPEIALTSLDGERFTTQDLRGRRVVLDFWATWCPPCTKEIPHFVQLTEENPREELLIIGISSEDVETLKEFVEEQQVNYPIVSTEDLPQPFDSILSIPTTFVVDQNGVIQNVLVGYHDYDHLKKLALAGDWAGESEETASGQP